MKTITKHSVIATVAAAVHAAADPHHVFHASQEVLGTYRRAQGEALASLVYTSTKAKVPMKALTKGFGALVKRRDAVLEGLNTCRVLYGFGKYTLTELGVWSCQMQTDIQGSAVWTAINTVPELVAVLRHDQKQLDLLMAWGRSIAHADEGTAAAGLITAEMLTAWERSLLAIGRGMKKNGKAVVPFKDGVAAEWALAAYDAVKDGGKPGAVLRGVGDAIKAAINAAYFANRNAGSVAAGYTMAGVVSGHKTAYHIMFPSTEGRRIHVARDAADGEESYAGADNILVDVGGRVVDLGNDPEVGEIEEAIQAYTTWEAQRADRLLEDGAMVMAALTCGIRHGDGTFDTFAELKDVVWGELAARGLQRKASAEEAKALQQAKLAMQVAAAMDGVNRRIFLSTQQHLPLQAAVALLKEEAAIVEGRQAKVVAGFDAAAAEAANEALEQARKPARLAREAALAEGARNSTALDAEMAEAADRTQGAIYEFKPVDREIMTVAEYRVLLAKAVTA